MQVRREWILTCWFSLDSSVPSWERQAVAHLSVNESWKAVSRWERQLRTRLMATVGPWMNNFVNGSPLRLLWDANICISQFIHGGVRVISFTTTSMITVEHWFPAFLSSSMTAEYASEAREQLRGDKKLQGRPEFLKGGPQCRSTGPNAKLSSSSRFCASIWYVGTS